MQAAVRARLHNMLAGSVRDICKPSFQKIGRGLVTVGQPKQVQVELLMANHVLLADMLGITPDAPDMQPEQVDTPDLEALRARLKQLPKATHDALCPAVNISPNHSWRGRLREPLEKHLMKKQTELMLALAVSETTRDDGWRWVGRSAPQPQPPQPPQPPAQPPAGEPLPAELTCALAASEMTAGSGSAALTTEPPPPPPPPPPPILLDVLCFFPICNAPC